jgi:hypothetical protein
MLPAQSPEIFELETNISHALLEIRPSVTVFLPRRHPSQNIGETPLSTRDIRVDVGHDIVVPCDGGHCRLDSLLTKVFL